MQELARRIAKTARESKIEIDETEYVKSFKVEMMDAVTQWCRGASFIDTCKVNYQLSSHYLIPNHPRQLVDVFEGSLIRVFRRLGELLRQMTAAVRAIGNDELDKKFTKASEMLERPNTVIFCASLYL